MSINSLVCSIESVIPSIIDSIALSPRFTANIFAKVLELILFIIPRLNFVYICLEVVDLLKAVIVRLALAILLFQPIQSNRHCRVIPYPIAQFGFENLAMISIDGDGFSINHFFGVRI